MLVDTWGREITYLRISVTDKCNLRCRYCMPEEGVDKLDHGAVLTIEEMYRMASLFVKAGIDKIRITGGEPLVRKGIITFVEDLHKLPLQDLSMTTNGTLLAGMAAQLKAAGLDRINIGIDSVNETTYANVTRGGSLKEALAGLSAALEAGLDPVKINAVVMRGSNDQELWEIAQLAKSRPIHVRFIEFMPIGGGDIWLPERFVPAKEMKEKLEMAAGQPLIPCAVAGNGPAEVFAFPGWQGSIAFIHAVSEHFCGRCNRLRFTSEGKIYSCLHSGESLDVFAPLRQGASDEELLGYIEQAVQRKPQRSSLGAQSRGMNTIGG